MQANKKLSDNSTVLLSSQPLNHSNDDNIFANQGSTKQPHFYHSNKQLPNMNRVPAYVSEPENQNHYPSVAPHGSSDAAQIDLAPDT